MSYGTHFLWAKCLRKIKEAKEKSLLSTMHDSPSLCHSSGVKPEETLVGAEGTCVYLTKNFAGKKLKP